MKDHEIPTNYINPNVMNEEEKLQFYYEVKSNLKERIEQIKEELYKLEYDLYYVNKELEKLEIVD